MSVIDQKGRIFGKLNIIDLIVVILIIAAIAVLGIKLTSHSGSADGEGQQVVYTVLVRNVEPEVYEHVKGLIPGQLYAEDELQNAYVTKVEATPVEENAVALEGNIYGTTTVTQEIPGNYDLVFTIEGMVQDNVSSKLGSQEIRVGKTHIVKTTEFELEHGVILSCERPGAAEEEAS